ncbi:hypothetical protein IGB42_00913 [Andreprevotia sp. IGB-42]|uniref:hypothetical protein n=1 Tax=Andreprevotia sp. IGB-42 TaxID=2497473 RepID=UPI00135B7ECF|nr:hypothetical protein [Andreprevotia sp. IGB-42]KAF0814857.1 hypothetical protein IGB42_00913 [Andreprevotia sp. IGB-42]
MIKSPLFLDVVLPLCVSGSLIGFFLMLILSRILYDYVQRHYGNLLAPTESQTMWVDQDMAMAFVGDVWALTRRRDFRVIASPFWRGLFWVNAGVGLIAMLALITLCAAFVL